MSTTTSEPISFGAGNETFPGSESFTSSASGSSTNTRFITVTNIASAGEPIPTSNPRPPTNENSEPPPRDGSNVGIIVGSIIVGVLLGLLLGIGIWCCRRRNKAAQRQRRMAVTQGGQAPDFVTISDHAPPTYITIPLQPPSSNVRVSRWLSRVNSERSAQTQRSETKDTLAQLSDTTSDSASMYSQSTYYSTGGGQNSNPNPFASTSTVYVAGGAGYTGLPMVEEADEHGESNRNSRASGSRSH